MIQIIPFLIKYRKIALTIVAVAATLLAVWYIYKRGGDHRESELRVESMEKEIKAHELNREIRSNRADTDALVKRLRDTAY